MPVKSSAVVPSLFPPVRSASGETAIIGAGMAGLTAAIRLQASGYPVVIFEKGRGPGGRLASRRMQNENGSVDNIDIGAQYFTIRSASFRAFLDRYAGPETYARWHGALRHQRQDSFWEPFAKGERYVGMPRMTVICHALAAHSEIRSRIRITQLARQSDHRILLSDSDGSTHGPFENVIISAPPAQAQSLLETLADQSFAADTVFSERPLAACWALAIRFRQSLALDHDGFACKHPVLQWAANNTSKPGRSSEHAAADEWWVLHGQAEWSEQHQNADKDWVVARMTEAFKEVTGTNSVPDEQFAHRWLYAKMVTGEAGPAYRWYPGQRIGLCGDWLTGGRVEGAFESAEALVDELSAR